MLAARGIEAETALSIAGEGWGGRKKVRVEAQDGKRK